MTEKKKVPIIEGLFSWPSPEPRLIASRCKKCSTVAFPKVTVCPNPDCSKGTENVEEILMNPRGKVWTWTIQRYPPPSPFKYEPFAPYSIAMVDLPEGIRVLGILSTTESVQIGSEVEMIVGKLWEDQENEYITWMWKPVTTRRRS